LPVLWTAEVVDGLLKTWSIADDSVEARRDLRLVCELAHRNSTLRAGSRLDTLSVPKKNGSHQIVARPRRVTHGSPLHG
jgi:hypothetical protein